MCLYWFVLLGARVSFLGGQYKFPGFIKQLTRF